MTFQKRFAIPLLSITAALCLGGCTTATPSGSAAPPATSAPAAKSLDLALVQSLTAPRFQKDPNCGYGEWSENSTGINEKFRASAKTIQQFDCYVNKDDVGGIPKRVQQSIFVEFTDAATAKSFAENESSLYPTLVDGPRVVVAGAGLDSVDMKAYLNDLKNACGCGEIIASGG